MTSCNYQIWRNGKYVPCGQPITNRGTTGRCHAHAALKKDRDYPPKTEMVEAKRYEVPA